MKALLGKGLNPSRPCHFCGAVCKGLWRSSAQGWRWSFSVSSGHTGRLEFSAGTQERCHLDWTIFLICSCCPNAPTWLFLIVFKRPPAFHAAASKICQVRRELPYAQYVVEKQAQIQDLKCVEISLFHVCQGWKFRFYSGSEKSFSTAVKSKCIWWCPGSSLVSESKYCCNTWECFPVTESYYWEQ